MILICFAFLLFFFRKRNSTQWQTTCTIITPWWYYCRTTMVSKTCHPLPWKLSRIKKTWTTATCWYWCSTTRLYHFFGPHYHYEIEIKNVKFKFKVWRVNFFGKQCKTLKILYAKNNGVPRYLLGFWKGREPQNFVKQAPPNTPQHKAYCVGVFSEGFFLCLKPVEETPTEPYNAKL